MQGGEKQSPLRSKSFFMELKKKKKILLHAEKCCTNKIKVFFICTHGKLKHFIGHHGLLGATQIWDQGEYRSFDSEALK